MPTATPDLMARLEELARFSANPPALTRLYFSPEQKARRLTGPDVNTTGGHVRAIRRYEGRTLGLLALMLGSHIDIVRNAGQYDGCLGVIAAMHQGQSAPAIAIQFFAFGDGERVRFPVTLSGSRAAYVEMHIEAGAGTRILESACAGRYRRQ